MKAKTWYRTRELLREQLATATEQTVQTEAGGRVSAWGLQEGSTNDNAALMAVADPTERGFESELALSV